MTTKDLEYVDDTYASEDVDAVSSNGADDFGDAINLQDTASPYEKTHHDHSSYRKVQFVVPRLRRLPGST
jgi:hypothetical protein